MIIKTAGRAVWTPWSDVKGGLEEAKRRLKADSILAENRRLCGSAAGGAVTKMTAGSITCREDER